MLRFKKIILFIFFSITLQGQEGSTTTIPAIIPPSPTAYELGKCGQIDIGTFTGTANIEVPLYTFKTKNLSIPISLSYNSNGILVDQIETNVGLGWNLNAGGVINRIVRGKPDEERYNPISEEKNCNSESFITYMTNNQWYDTQPDIYSYNFQGHSGKFVFDKHNKAVLIPQNNLKIEKLSNNNGFKIITDDGIEYQFFDIEFSTWEHILVPQTVATGWYLSKIIHPHGDIVNFTYRNTNYSYITNINQSLPIKISEEPCGDSGYSDTQVVEENTFNTLNILGKIIESISSTDTVFGKLTFQHLYNPNYIGSFLIKGYQVHDNKQNNIENTVFNYTFSANKRIFLSECIFKDTSKKYSFEYEDPEHLVERLSSKRDLWGFFNGKGGNYPDPVIHKELYLNNSLIINQIKLNSPGDKRPYEEFAKKGILRKIVYPTKGYNEFEYESNSVMGTITSPLQLQDKTIKLYNHGFGSAVLTDSFEFENKVTYDTQIEATIISDAYDSGNDVFPEGDVNIAVTVENLVHSDLNMTFYTTSYNKPKVNIYKFEANTNYRITVVYTPGIQTTARVMFNYCVGGGIESVGIVPVGGLRIKEVRSFDTQLNRSDIKHYYYRKKDTPNITSGVEGFNMRLVTNEVIKRICYGGIVSSGNPFLVTTNIFRIHSNSIYQFYKSNSSNSTTYENVTISHGGSSFENGGEELYYAISSDTKPVACLGSRLISTPWTNSSWDNGLLLKKIIFNNKLDTLNQSIYNYKLEDQYTKEVVGIAFDFKFNPIYGYSMSDIRAIEHLNINKYSTNSYWFYLESEQNAQYDLNGLNPITTTTTYKYNNPLHLKLSSQSTVNSLGEKIETKYFYPSDPEMADEPFRNELIAKNMIGKVLDTQVFKKGVKLSEQKTIYAQSASTSSLLLPKSIYGNKGLDPIDLNSDKEITFDKYDDKGNLLQYTPEAGAPVSFIWGYSRTQPIAKIENATYDQVISYVSNLQTLSNGDYDNCVSSDCTEQILRNALNDLRTACPQSMVTTYTYNPLIGVTSVTDPKGSTSFYEYDSFGRLKFVKDKDLNILQKYCYNYKGQQINCDDNSSTTIIKYKSIAKTGSFIKNNCIAGGVGSSINYSQAEGVIISTISQADADTLGLSKFNTDGQEFANTNGTCTYSSIARSGSFTKNNCAAGGAGSSVSYSQNAGVVTSTVSQADADALGLSKFNTDGQVYANTNGTCTFSSTARSGSFAKNNCTSGTVGSSVNYSQNAGVETSTVSQADADALGLSRFNTDGQANANTNGTCSIPLPAAPTGLAFTNATATTLNFSWTAVAGATSYKIYKNGTDTGITSSGNTGSLSGLTASTAYSIQVSAVNASGNSILSTAVSMNTASVAISNICYLNFNRVSGTCALYKNGSNYLSRTNSGTSSGTLAAGDTFYVTVGASSAFYKSITITSSVRGLLYNYSHNTVGSSATSPTFTKTGSEVITIDCVATDMLD